MKTQPTSSTKSKPMKPLLAWLLIFTALAAFVLAFILADNAYFRWLDSRFPRVGDSVWLATLWGVVSRAHLLILAIPFIVWKSRQLGFQMGQIRQHGRMLLVMLLANCGILAAYLWLTGSGTPYSGDQWLITEVVSVPFVEELIWRGLVFAALQTAFRRYLPEQSDMHGPVWLSGVAFGLLHTKNIIAGVPVEFAALQALNATIWGVVYGYARAKTGSIYPPMLLHAAMNFVVILF